MSDIKDLDFLEDQPLPSLIEPQEMLVTKVSEITNNLGAVQNGSGDSVFKANPSYGIWLGNSDFASAPFKVSMAGVLTATGATITGTITVTSIDIGGDDATSAHIDTDGNLWLGASVANKATAPARISNAGVAVFTDITATGTINATAGYMASGFYLDTVDSLLCESGGINVGVAGHVRGGQTAYNVGTGFFLGYDMSAYKFSIGRSASDHITWDGSALDVKGVVTLSGTFQAKSYTVATLPAPSGTYKSPSSTAGVSGDAWTNPTNAYASDGSYAQMNDNNSTADWCSWYGFGLGVPSDATIVGIEIAIESKCESGVDKDAYIKLSWNSGGSWTATETLSVSTTESVRTVGGATSLWGRTWAASEFATAVFRVAVSDFPTIDNTHYVDHIRAKVYFTTIEAPVTAGSMAYASNGRKAGEGAGNGTGVLVFYDNNGNWIASDTGATVAA